MIKCEMIWASVVKEIQCHDGKHTVRDNVPCEGIPSSPTIRRIISSDILDCILMGSIQVSRDMHVDAQLGTF